jgi:pyruvate kinase
MQKHHSSPQAKNAAPAPRKPIPLPPLPKLTIRIPPRAELLAQTRDLKNDQIAKKAKSIANKVKRRNRILATTGTLPKEVERIKRKQKSEAAAGPASTLDGTGVAAREHTPPIAPSTES